MPPVVRCLGVAVAAALFAASCASEEVGPQGELGSDRQGPNPGPVPTLPGGVELAGVDPAILLVGQGLAFGSLLPSRARATEGYTDEPGVAAAVGRVAYSARSGRPLGEVTVLSLDGEDFFDEQALDAFQRGLVTSLSGGEVSDLPLAGRTALQATGPGGAVVGFRAGDAFVTVTSGPEADALLVARLMLEARAGGERGTGTPATPLVHPPVDAAFVAVPTVTFAPIPADDDLPPPEVPSFPGATGVQGRYGVVAGERRSVVWAFTLDPAAHSRAEGLAAPMAELASALADGAPVEEVEMVDRVVVSASQPAGEPSSRVFRHQGLVLAVAGLDAAQLDVVVSAWIAALAGHS